MVKKSYILGLDIGVASIGWGMLGLDETGTVNSMLDTGVLIFKPLDNDKGKLYNVDRREKRGQRRIRRRRVERLRRIKNLLKFHHFYTSEQELYGKEQKHEDVYLLRSKGLKDQLSLVEISRVLVHYAKNRGFQSNRKAETTDDKQEKKMTAGIAKVNEIIHNQKCYLIDALLYIKQTEKKETIKNQAGSYLYAYDRTALKDEAIAFLTKQQEYYPLISHQFIESYLDILLKQRDFSEGPDAESDSPYIVNFQKMMGLCPFRKAETRIVKSAPSQELFTLYQKLQNLSYYPLSDSTQKKRALTTEQIASFIALAKKNKKITYKKISQYLATHAEEVKIIDVPKLSYDDWKKQRLAFFQKLNLDEHSKLTDEQYQLLDAQVSTKRLDKVFYELKSYHQLKDQLKKLVPKELFDKTLADSTLLDNIATVLSYAQTDASITKTMTSNPNEQETTAKAPKIFIPEELQPVLYQINWSNKGTGSLATSLVQDINALFQKGCPSYVEAMRQLGYDHAQPHGDIHLKPHIFPTVSEIEKYFADKITQPNVRHMLVMLRKLYNTLAHKYGVPTNIHIEVAREMAKSYKKRQTIETEQITNAIRNQRIDHLLQEDFLVSQLKKNNENYISADDRLKYRLFEDQGGVCAYTGAIIQRERLLTNDYQIDHIFPFSITADNSYRNKVLVTAQANQEKSNRTPMQWMKSTGNVTAFKKHVATLTGIGRDKHAKLLFEGKLENQGFTAQHLHATAYATKLCAKIFKAMLKEEDSHDEKTPQKVKTFKGQHTAYLRKYYQLNKYTHSYESPTYLKKDAYSEYQYFITAHTIDVEKLSVTLTLENSFKNQVEHTYKIIERIDKKTGKTTYFSEHDQSIMQLIQQKTDLEKILTTLHNKQLHQINKNFYLQLIETQQEKATAYIHLFRTLLTGLETTMQQKNRAQHLQHAVDALLVASMTNSQQQRLTKFHQYLETFDYQTDDAKIYTEDGEVITKKQLMEALNINTHISPYLNFPEPYPHFRDELILRVFERNEAALKEALAKLPQMQNTPPKVLFPVHYYTKKISRGLHDETIFSLDILNGEKQTFKKMTVQNLEKKPKEFLAIVQAYYEAKQQKHFFAAFNQWRQTKEKQRSEYPVLKNGHVIKKMKVPAIDFKKAIPVSPTNPAKGYAKIAEVARILVFTHPEKNDFFFAQIDNTRYLPYKQKNPNLTVQLWWGQAKNNLVTTWHELIADGYQLIHELIPGQTIELQTKTSALTICKVVGFSSGMFTIGSILGDASDLLFTQIQPKIKKEYQITVSQIVQLNIIHYNFIGECL